MRLPDLRDGALGNPEKIGNNFFDHMLPLVEQRYHDRFLAPPSVKGFGSHLPSTDTGSRCLSGAPCQN
jgi:hypothetical protein